MQVLIYGGGAVGLGIASCLIKGGAQVDILGRDKTVGALKTTGLRRTGVFGPYEAEATAFESFNSLTDSQNTPYDYILVCTKSFDSPATASDLSLHRDIFGKSTKIVLFQNGWGNAEKFLPFFEREKIYNARVITGFELKNPNEVEVTVHADSIHIGNLFGCDISVVKPLCETISHGDIPCEITDKIERDLWAKMLYNCALNPLGAILDVPYGELAEHNATREVMEAIVREIFAVMELAGFKTHWSKSDYFLKAFYDKLVPETAQHRSSTLHDIRAKKMTEIDALNGAVIKIGKACGVGTPYNLAVYNIIKFMEAKNLYG